MKINNATYSIKFPVTTTFTIVGPVSPVFTITCVIMLSGHNTNLTSRQMVSWLEIQSVAHTYMLHYHLGIAIYMNTQLYNFEREKYYHRVFLECILSILIHHLVDGAHSLLVTLFCTLSTCALKKN